MGDGELVLPAFELDCRDWIVLGPVEAGMPEQKSEAEAPVLAVLSTAVIDDDIHEVSGALTVGLLEDQQLPSAAAGATVLELVDVEAPLGSRRYLMPVPGGQRLALLAEFAVPPGDPDDELMHRVERLMASFRWQAA